MVENAIHSQCLRVSSGNHRRKRVRITACRLRIAVRDRSAGKRTADRGSAGKIRGSGPEGADTTAVTEQCPGRPHASNPKLKQVSTDKNAARPRTVPCVGHRDRLTVDHRTRRRDGDSNSGLIRCAATTAPARRRAITSNRCHAVAEVGNVTSSPNDGINLIIRQRQRIGRRCCRERHEHRGDRDNTFVDL